MLSKLLFCGLSLSALAYRHGVTPQSVAEVKSPGKGDPCTCGRKRPTENKLDILESLRKNTCCAAGLICSDTDHVCKPAIGGPCKPKTGFSTECAAGTYGRKGDISCQKFKNVKNDYKCCIKKGDEPWDNDASKCCSGQKMDGFFHDWGGYPMTGKCLWVASRVEEIPDLAKQLAARLGQVNDSIVGCRDGCSMLTHGWVDKWTWDYW